MCCLNNPESIHVIYRFQSAEPNTCQCYFSTRVTENGWLKIDAPFKVKHKTASFTSASCESITSVKCLSASNAQVLLSKRKSSQFIKYLLVIAFSICLCFLQVKALTCVLGSLWQRSGSVWWCQWFWDLVLLPGEPGLRLWRRLYSDRPWTGCDPAPKLWSG